LNDKLCDILRKALREQRWEKMGSSGLSNKIRWGLVTVRVIAA
jgi:hypothetical protein